MKDTTASFYEESKSALYRTTKNSSAESQHLLVGRGSVNEYSTFLMKEDKLGEMQEKEGVEDDNVSVAGSDHKSTSSFLAKTNSNEPRELALDMFLSSIDLSFFTLPLVFQAMGIFFSTGFFFYLLVLSLMASQCYIELKRFSRIARGRERDYVGLIDLIEECCGGNSPAIHGKWLMRGAEVYLKSVTISTLVMLFAIN